MGSIEHIHRKDIDLSKWDDCVMQHSSVPYNLSWYLDIVTNNEWEALIYHDYQVVLPIPFNKKILGFKQTYRPVFCQHFTVCGDQVTEALVRSFLKKLPQLYRKVTFPVQVISKDRIRDLGMKVEECTNLLIPLQKPYEEIVSNYSKSLRKRLKNASETLMVEDVNQGDLVVDYYKRQLAGKSGLSSEHYAIARDLFKACVEHEMIQMLEVRNEGEDPLAMGIFLDFRGRLINMFGASNAEGREKYAMHLLIDHVIKQNCESHRLFDFEGSDLMGVREFFQSFGAEYQPYFTLTSDNLPWLVKELFSLYKRKR